MGKDQPSTHGRRPLIWRLPRKILDNGAVFLLVVAWSGPNRQDLWALQALCTSGLRSFDNPTTTEEHATKARHASDGSPAPASSTTFWAVNRANPSGIKEGSLGMEIGAAGNDNEGNDGRRNARKMERQEAAYANAFAVWGAQAHA
ncbi:unnamed protein product, partial [Amoebophrya sp. A25]|eukprot:GSA25T00005810001.1